jgi:hypothetical protein
MLHDPVMEFYEVPGPVLFRFLHLNFGERLFYEVG